MKAITATEARKNWFRLLDDTVGGETFVIERRGRRILVQLESAAGEVAESAPDYRRSFRAPGADDADAWTWDWSGSLEPRDRSARGR